MAKAKKVTFSKSNLTTNLETLKNLEPSFGVILEIKTIPNYLHGFNPVFNMAHILE